MRERDRGVQRISATTRAVAVGSMALSAGLRGPHRRGEPGARQDRRPFHAERGRASTPSDRRATNAHAGRHHDDHHHRRRARRGRAASTRSCPHRRPRRPLRLHRYRAPGHQPPGDLAAGDLQSAARRSSPASHDRPTRSGDVRGAGDDGRRALRRRSGTAGRARRGGAHRRRSRSRVQSLPRRLRSLPRQRATRPRRRGLRVSSWTHSTSRCTAPVQPTGSSIRRSVPRCARSATTATSRPSIATVPRCASSCTTSPAGTACRSIATRGTVRVPKGVELDLGATAKAWCADRAAQAAAERRGCGVVVGLGGDLACAGDPPEGGWRVRVADDHRAAPDAPGGQTVWISAAGSRASGTSVRRWSRGGRSLHHVIDPSTSLPAADCWRTASVVAASCADANIASTAAIVLGADAPAWLAARAPGGPTRRHRRPGHRRRGLAAGVFGGRLTSTARRSRSNASVGQASTARRACSSSSGVIGVGSMIG